MADKFVKVKLKLDAVIGGIAFPDIVSMSATFGLNSIPTASIVVAVGKDYKRDRFATIHTARSQLKPRDPVQVFLTMIPEDGDVSKIPRKDYKIFEGYLSGIGYQRSHNSANFVISVVHWLDDLNNSGALTGNWMPGASYDLAQCALYNILSEEDGALLGLGTPTLDPRRELVNIPNLQGDMWLRTLRPIYEKLAEWAKARQQALPGSGNGGGTNSGAIGPTSLGPGALSRMPGNGAQYYTPVALDLKGLGGTEIEDCIRAGLQIVDVNSFAYTTFWNKIVGETAPQFFFAISPAVDWALPIPFFAGLRQEWKTIKADEYSYANFNANMSQLLESVDVFYPINNSMTNSSGMGSVTGAVGLEKPLGFYPAAVDQNNHGLKLYKEPPGWLSNPVRWNRKTPGTTGEGGPLPGDMSAPNFGSSSSPVKSPRAMLEMIKNSDVATRLAEHWYKSEYLYQRYGEMSGYLRFDIAPGSIVKIETPPRDQEWYGDSNPYMFATVTQVSYSINAERAMAGTSFSLAHIRTEEENNDESITSAKPPMFLEKWKGGPLSDSGS